jgi:hypothetical protein
MAQRNRFQNRRPARPAATAAPVRNQAAEVLAAQQRVKTVYGEPFILLEDANKNTFEYRGGAWVAHSKSIKECRVDCQVKELSQKLNRMTRYEIRSPLPAD